MKRLFAFIVSTLFLFLQASIVMAVACLVWLLFWWLSSRAHPVLWCVIAALAFIFIGSQFVFAFCAKMTAKNIALSESIFKPEHDRHIRFYISSGLAFLYWFLRVLSSIGSPIAKFGNVVLFGNIFAALYVIVFAVTAAVTADR